MIIMNVGHDPNKEGRNETTFYISPSIQGKQCNCNGVGNVWDNYLGRGISSNKMVITPMDRFWKMAEK